MFVFTWHRCFAINAKLCILTDTDNLIYHVELMWYVYNIMKLDINRFDTSDFIDKPYDIPLANKKVPGLVKDENND